ncbi:MAG: hypothetical protein MRY63_06740 [Neomegalonema sp.]|nr:hypothetical protein [Neomegalonema sp.]
MGVGEFHDALDKALAGETDPWERLRIACRTHLGQTLRLGNRVAIVQPDLSNTSDDVRGRLIEVREIYEDRWRALVDDLGLRPEVSASLCRLMIFGAMNWATVWYREGGQSPEEIADAFVAMLRDGVAQHP